MHRQIADDSGRLVALELDRALVGRIRKLRRVEELIRLQVLIELRATRVDRRNVGRHFNGASLRRAVERHGALRLVELATPDRQAANVVGLETRVRVVRIKLVR